MVADHEPPLSRGGRFESAVLACKECDKRRSQENAIGRKCVCCGKLATKSSDKCRPCKRKAENQ